MSEEIDKFLLMHIVTAYTGGGGRGTGAPAVCLPSPSCFIRVVPWRAWRLLEQGSRQLVHSPPPHAAVVIKV